jgi:hypothetical protein
MFHWKNIELLILALQVDCKNFTILKFAASAVEMCFFSLHTNCLQFLFMMNEILFRTSVQAGFLCMSLLEILMSDASVSENP